MSRHSTYNENNISKVLTELKVSPVVQESRYRCECGITAYSCSLPNRLFEQDQALLPFNGEDFFIQSRPGRVLALQGKGSAILLARPDRVMFGNRTYIEWYRGVDFASNNTEAEFFYYL